MTPPSQPLVSIVIPCYNEAKVLALTYQELKTESEKWPFSAEIIFVDDGSTDETWSLIQSFCEHGKKVRGVRLSRNFGHQAATGAGLEHASGRAILVMDADLQDPPNLIPSMVKKWQEGFYVVYAKRTKRTGESFCKKLFADLFYRLMAAISEVPILRNTGEFALMDAKVVELLLSSKEYGVFWRGLRTWMGFRQSAVTFVRPPRAAGVSKYNTWKSLQLALDAFFSHSTLLRKMVTLACIAFSVLMAGGGFFLLMAFPFISSSITLLWSIALLACSLTILSLGMILEYAGRIYTQTLGRPRWVVEEIFEIRLEPLRRIARPELRPHLMEV